MGRRPHDTRAACSASPPCDGPCIPILVDASNPRLPWDRLRAMRRNTLKAKGRDLRKLCRAILTGFAFPVFVWLEGDLVLDGAGRVPALEELEAVGHVIPDEIPVAMIEARDEKHAGELVLMASSNHGLVTEQSLEDFVAQHEVQLAAMAEMVEFQGIELERMADGPGEGNGASEDPGPGEPPEEPRTKLGDLYIMGDHRLMCGDLVEQVWDGSGCFIWDPPWDADPMVPCAPHLVFADGFRVGPAIAKFGAPYWLFTWDCVSSWYTPNRPLRRAKYALSYAGLDEYDFNGSHYGDAGEPRTVTNTRGSYEFQPDPRGKHLSDVFSAPITQREDGRHPHEKPVDWLRMLIANCRPGASLIEDPCAGSGATLIASEQLGRKWIGTELSPAYCDVIVERWEKMTGKKAELIRNG